MRHNFKQHLCFFLTPTSKHMNTVKSERWLHNLEDRTFWGAWWTHSYSSLWYYVWRSHSINKNTVGYQHLSSQTTQPQTRCPHRHTHKHKHTHTVTHLQNMTQAEMLNPERDHTHTHTHTNTHMVRVTQFHVASFVYTAAPSEDSKWSQHTQSVTWPFMAF